MEIKIGPIPKQFTLGNIGVGVTFVFRASHPPRKNYMKVAMSDPNRTEAMVDLYVTAESKRHLPVVDLGTGEIMYLNPDLEVSTFTVTGAEGVFK